MLMFVHELSEQPIQTTVNRRSSLQDSDIMIEYDKGICDVPRENDDSKK